MKKTSLYIDPEVDRALDRRAVAEGITKAELVRRVLADAVSRRSKPRARGVFEGPRNLGSDAERHLADTGFGEE
ncbi:MAG TPA: CopG family transcriptional regulator [Rubrobacteraceae bacterium]|nr:CopG family transcriptional regulator [Rubrobacteraceae bacterium]